MATTYTIPNGAQYMAATLWTGTGAAQTITNGVAGKSFQPDFIWIKSRANADYHNVNDVVRGIVVTGSPNIFPNTFDAQATFTGYGVSALNSNGFNLIGNGSYTNASGQSYVGWQWKAGGTAVSNTSGSLTSSVSANTTAGFSVVTYTGNSSTTQTVGHGLGAIPSLIIAKCTSLGSTNWVVYNSNISNPLSNFVSLNRTDTNINVANYWGASLPTSSVFGVAAGGYDNNQNGQSQVAYCFAPIAGYSAFGVYTGNGSADGPFIYTGFRPRLVIFKAISGSAYNWDIMDTTRSPYNASNLALNPNLADVESSPTTIDFLSNGIKIRQSSSGNNNDNGSQYLYMAWAENPFKYANAR